MLSKPTSVNSVHGYAAAEFPSPSAVAKHPDRKPPLKSTRSLLIDVVRGIAISLVVLGHTNQGVAHRNWWGTSLTGIRLNSFIYAFHMPAFFFVSGVFLCASVARRGSWAFAAEKLRTIFYPYLLWSCFAALNPLFLGRFMSSHVPTWKMYLVGVSTGRSGWFLPTLLFAVLAGMLLRRVPMPILFILTCVASLYWRTTGVTFIDRGIQHLPFLVAGMWAGRSCERIERIPRVSALAAATVIGLLTLTLTNGPFLYSPYLFIPLGLLGTLMLLLLAHVLGQSHAARLLAWVGMASFGVFLLSAYFQGGCRELLLYTLHVREPYLQLLLPTIVAILVPAWIFQNRKMLHVEWLFVWPFQPFDWHRETPSLHPPQPR